MPDSFAGETLSRQHAFRPLLHGLQRGSPPCETIELRFIGVQVAVLQGVHAALITPRRADGNDIDIAATLDLIDFACGRGLDGVVLLGSTGEFVHFDVADRLKLIRLATKRSPVPVTVNVSHSSLDGALTLARAAATHGAAALLLMPPHFFPYEQAEIEEFFVRFARGSGVGLPLLLYNVPSFTTPIHFETAMRVLASGLFAGIKDSSGRMDDFRKMAAVKAQAPFTLLIGDDRIFADTRLEGADGVISGVAVAVPELMVGLEKAILSGAVPKRDRLEARLHEFIAWIARFPVPWGIKEAVGLRGLRAGAHASPPGKEAERKLSEFREWFQDWLPKVLKEAAGA